MADPQSRFDQRSRTHQEIHPFQGFELTYRGQVTLCLEGCSPMSEAGTCLKGESKNTHKFGFMTDRNLCWLLSLILAVWGPVEPGGPSLESKMLKEEAGKDPLQLGEPSDAQQPTCESCPMAVALFCPPEVSLGPPWWPLSPELHREGDSGERVSPVKSAPYKACTADEGESHEAEKERIFLRGDGTESLGSDANGCLF